VLPERIEEALPERLAAVLPDAVEEALPQRLAEVLPDKVEEALAERLTEVLPRLVEAAVQERLAEILAKVQPEIVDALQSWLARDAAQIISRELDGVAAGINKGLTSRFRADILPQLDALLEAGLEPPQKES